MRTHVDAMGEIRRILADYPPEERMVVASGILGDILCEVGPDRSRTAAVAFVGTALDMVLDMVNRTYPPQTTGKGH